MDLMLLFMVLIWGVNYSVIKIRPDQLRALRFQRLRFGLATLLMLILLEARGESLHVARRDIPVMIVLGMTGQGIYQLLFISGVARRHQPIRRSSWPPCRSSPPSSHISWASSVPTARSGLACHVICRHLVAGARRKRRRTGAARQHDLLGDLLCLCAAIAVGGQHAGQPSPAPPLFAGQGDDAADVDRHAAFDCRRFAVDAAGAVESGAAGSLGRHILFSGTGHCVGYILWSVGLQRVGNARTAIYSNLTPIISAVYRLAAVHDGLRLPQIIGAAVAISGLLLRATWQGLGSQRAEGRAI